MRATAVAVPICISLLTCGVLTAQAETAHFGDGGISVSANYNSSTRIVRAKTSRKKVAITKAKSRRTFKKRSGQRTKYLAMAKKMKPRGLPISLVDAVISMESGYRQQARGRHGEIGLMQVKPATARMVRNLTGVKGGSLANATNNLRIGMAYLNWCYKRARGKVPATIGCYNAGPGNMWKWQKFAVTRKYVRYVRSRMVTN